MSTLNVDTLQDKAGAFEHARLVQVVNVLNVAMTTGTTAIAHDDTIPQKTEGDEIMTLAITPTHASNKLLIEVVVQYATASNVAVSSALFQDTTANALACGAQYGSNSEQSSMTFSHYMTTGTTSSTTFKVRVGATSGTTTINGLGGARKYGGVNQSSMTISEIRV
jgi:hypothetical protein